MRNRIKKRSEAKRSETNIDPEEAVRLPDGESENFHPSNENIQSNGSCRTNEKGNGLIRKKQ